MAKTKQPSMADLTNANSVVLQDTLDTLYGWRDRIPSEPFLENLCLELMAWSNKDDSMRIKDFCRSKKIEEFTLQRWAKQYPKVNIAYRYALDGIASRREDGLIFKGWPATTIHSTMGHYDKVWRSEQNYKEFLKAKMMLFVAEHKHDLENLSGEDLSNCFEDWLIKQEKKENDEDKSGTSS